MSEAIVSRHAGARSHGAINAHTCHTFLSCQLLVYSTVILFPAGTFFVTCPESQNVLNDHYTFISLALTV